MEQKKQENEALLLSILPAPVVERLKTDKAQIADSVKLATIMFARISGMAVVNQVSNSQKITALLNELISSFDRAAIKHEVSKIKTNGDLYIASCGVLKPRLDSTKLMMAFAVEMFSILQKFNHDHQEELDEMIGRELRLSIGIDDGPVLAGIVGREKFSYDVWGETVSVADFLQLNANSESSEIMVTQEVYERLQDLYQFERGEDLEIHEIEQKLETWVIRNPLINSVKNDSVDINLVKDDYHEVEV